MSLDKAIRHGKEKRKPYRGGKACSTMCRNHGGCTWCEGGRLHKHKKRELMWKGDENESVRERK